MKTTPKQRAEIVARLVQLGVSYEHAETLRRISMTLQRWFELECGDGNDFASWCITRGHRKSERKQTEQGLNVRVDTFEHDENGKPYLETHSHHGPPQPIYTKLADRETGARKRLAALMASYPDLVPYIQTDPRGCAVYVLKKSDVNGCEIDQVYTRGIAVY